jgi:hypothetical protein
MGAKYVMADLGKVHEKLLANEIAKKIIVFSMFFVATRDIVTAFVLMVFYVLIVDGLLHESRLFSIVKPNPTTEQTVDKYDTYINHLYTVRTNDTST